MRRLVLLLAATLACASNALARDLVPAEQRYFGSWGFTAQLPACDDPSVLGSLSSSFDSREYRFWGNLAVAGYDRVKPVAFRPWGADFIPRRFCTARVTLSDGKTRQVDYSVREDLGLFGWTWNVNWCVHGLDRHMSNAPDCRMARP
jgi:hypothetical protein